MVSAALLLLGAPILALPRTPPLTPAPAVAGRGEVTITTVEYRALVEAADTAGLALPAQARAETARFRVTVEKDSADFEETFEIRATGAGWIALPVVRGALDWASVAPPERGFFFVTRDVTRLAVQGPGSASARIGAKRAALFLQGRRRFTSLPLHTIRLWQHRSGMMARLEEEQRSAPCQACPSRARVPSGGGFRRCSRKLLP